MRIFTTSSGTDIVCAALIGLNITGFVVEDPKDFEEFLNDKTARWDYVDSCLDELLTRPVSVKVYVPDSCQGKEQLSLIKDELAALKSRDSSGTLGSLEVLLSQVADADWENNWKQYFKPLPIGEKLIIKPSWEELSADNKRKVIELDPETSFGTGRHATTRLCLENLESVVSDGDRVLDLGCGSGILSIACLRLGAGSVTAVDIEENSVKIAGKNLKNNGLRSDSFSLYCGNIIDDPNLRESIGGGFDVVCANIVADILIAMSPHFGDFLKYSGKLILSGIISERKQEVLEVAEKYGLELSGSREDEGWASFVFKKTRI